MQTKNQNQNQQYGEDLIQQQFGQPNEQHQNPDEYYEQLRKKQQEHLDKVKRIKESNWQPCLHDACESCCGTGVKADGTACVHFISCSCPKCKPYFL